MTITTPILPGFVRVSNLRRGEESYAFNLTLDEITLRDVYYRHASGEYGFPPQRPMNISAETAGVFSEALEALTSVLAARPSLGTDILLPLEVL